MTPDLTSAAASLALLTAALSLSKSTPAGAPFRAPSLRSVE
ncbi:MAG TPA: hypothetical protein VJR89_16025 [Polyangiales bacterium]|nr:hypothetical protein [Polyangiales bacterium]